MIKLMYTYHKYVDDTFMNNHTIKKIARTYEYTPELKYNNKLNFLSLSVKVMTNLNTKFTETPSHSYHYPQIYTTFILKKIADLLFLSTVHLQYSLWNGSQIRESKCYQKYSMGVANGYNSKVTDRFIKKCSQNNNNKSKLVKTAKKVPTLLV